MKVLTTKPANEAYLARDLARMEGMTLHQWVKHMGECQGYSEAQKRWINGDATAKDECQGEYDFLLKYEREQAKHREKKKAEHEVLVKNITGLDLETVYELLARTKGANCAIEIEPGVRLTAGNHSNQWQWLMGDDGWSKVLQYNREAHTKWA